MFSINRARESKRRHTLRQAVESLETRVLLAYTLDPSFAGDGIAEGQGGGIFAVQSDNKIIARVPNSTPTLTRLNTDGSVDTSFGGTGQITVPFPIADVVVAGGKLLVAGVGTGGGFSARGYNLDGTLDLSFGGGDGIATSTLSGFVSDMAVGPTGKILLVGGNFNSDEGYDIPVMAATRFNSDGSIDMTFDGDGVKEHPVVGWIDAYYTGAGFLSNGEMIVTDYRIISNHEGPSYGITRWSADGTQETSEGGFQFDWYGRPNSINDLEILPDDSYLIATGNRISRYGGTGSFNNNGLLLNTFNGPYTSPEQNDIITGLDSSNGKILVTGYLDESRGFVARLLPNGDPDPSFSGTSNGIVVIGNNTTAYDVLVDSNNRPIVGGLDSSGAFVARLADLPQSPRSGTPFAVGQTIQAEDFDNGGEASAYHDTDATNNGGAYRPTEGVDIEPTNDTSGGYHVGWAWSGEWLEYTFNIASGGNYTIDTRLASPKAGGKFHYEVDGNPTGQIDIPNTGSFTNFTTINTKLGFLVAGTHVLRLAIDPGADTGGQANFNWMKISPSTAAGDAGTGLTGYYYNNMDFTSLAVNRNDPKIDFNWAAGSPDARIDPDTFSVKWTGKFQAPATGYYTFYTTTDDGVRLTVDGSVVIDHLTPQPATEWSSQQLFFAAGQKYDIKLEYFERQFDAQAKLAWSGPGISKQTIPTQYLYPTFIPPDNQPPTAPVALRDYLSNDTEIHVYWSSASDNVAVDGYEARIDNGEWLPVPSGDQVYTFPGLQPGSTHTVEVRAFDTVGNRGPAATLTTTTTGGPTTTSGLKGEYFNNSDFTAPVLTRTDQMVSFNWGTGSPAPGIDPDTFSVRWTAKITVPTTGRYTFYTSSDDGARLWVNGQLLVDKLVPQSLTTWSGSIDLVAGQAYDFKMEYFDRSGGAEAILYYSGPGITKQIVPASAFSSTSSGPDTTAPSAVPNFRVTGLSATRITVSWDAASDNVGVTGYELNIDNGDWITGSADARTYTFSNLQPGTTHTMNIRAFDAAANRGPITTISQTTPNADPESPSAVPNFTATRVAPTEIDVKWDAATDNVGVTWYELRLNGGSSIFVSPSQRTYTFNNLTPSTNYTITIDATDAAGNRGPVSTVTATTPAAPSGGLSATYFNNMDFTAPVFTRSDSNINFNWGTGSPASGIDADTFSVRWTGKITAPTTGRYTFYTTTDDGVRLWVNNQLLIDKLVPQAATEWSGSIDLVAGQQYDIRMDYFDRSGGAQAKLSWSGPGITKTIVPSSAFGSSGGDNQAPTSVSNFRSTFAGSDSIALSWNEASDNVGIAGYEMIVDNRSPVILNPSARTYVLDQLQPNTTYRFQITPFDAAGNRGPSSSLSVTTAPTTSGGSGLTGQYFNNMDFTAPVMSRTDSNINFNWGTGSPAAGIDADTFSVRWTGFITVPTTGRYTFYTTTDDGARLTINGVKIIDKLVPQAATEWSGSIDLVAGQKYSFTLEYFDRSGGAQAKLQWSGPNISKQVVPQTAFTLT